MLCDYLDESPDLPPLPHALGESEREVPLPRDIGACLNLRSQPASMPGNWIAAQGPPRPESVMSNHPEVTPNANTAHDAGAARCASFGAGRRAWTSPFIVEVSMNTAPADNFIPSALISSELLALTGDAGPGRRKLIELAASAKVPMIKAGREWGCYRSRLPDLAATLGLIPKVEPKAPTRRRVANPSV